VPHLSTNPTFSVIIASYNAAATLSKAINSVLAQTYPAYEIIIVDDGSSDDTALVAKGHGNKIRYHFQKNAGVSSARNKGAELAQGDWLAFLDADDWYYPQRLQHHAELLQRHPDLDFLIGDYHYGRADGSIIRRAMETTVLGLATLAAQDEYASAVLDVSAMGELIPAYFGHTLTLSLPTAKFLALGGYPLSFSIGEDLHLLIRLCANSRQAGVSCDPRGVYYVHDAGLMRKDVVKAQLSTVATLSSLAEGVMNAPAPIRKGFLLLLMNARFDLATALLRQGQRWQASMVFFPSVLESRSWRSLKMWLSIIKG
jgi:glycosyltransferase involved in cell wall biosynthesis